jgi:hypothetical protein
LNAAVSKTVVRLIGVPRVRISPPPFGVEVRAFAADFGWVVGLCEACQSPLEAAGNRLSRGRTGAQLARIGPSWLRLCGLVNGRLEMVCRLRRKTADQLVGSRGRRASGPDFTHRGIEIRLAA